MKNVHGNTFECDVGEIVTITFRPSDTGILRVLYKERLTDNLKDVGDDFKWERTLGETQVNLEVVYVFFPGASGNCQILLEGSGGGGTFENKPAAKDNKPPQHRTYRFIPQ